ncbi:MFS transporter [Streptomyces sp. A012304]|uniref:MFS transporter n=1 Tax=Streptomyces sp. A012304 TaxID=375446 RepID=UPI00222F18B6|nr:MFS transporter [Streptomyces sp. A012304]GKQ40547.1 MFS transporter [Streptomyces sp. A012304]
MSTDTTGTDTTDMDTTRTDASGTDTGTGKGAGRGSRFVPLLAVGAFALGLDAYVMAGLLPDVASGLRVSEASAGQMVTVFTLCYALAAPVFATALAGRPAKVVLACALAVFSVGNALSALAPSLPVLLVARALAGIGAGLYSPTAAATAAGLAGEERRGRSLALVMGGMSIGTVVGVPLGVMLAEHMGWRGTLWLITALGLLALAGIALLPTTTAGPPPALRDRVRILADGRVAGIAVVSLLGGIASLGLYTYLAPFLKDAAGSGDTVGPMWAWGAGGVAGSLLIGRIVDRTRRPFAVVTGVLTLLAVAHLALPSAAGTSWVLFVPLVVWGAAGWALQVPQQHQLIAAQPQQAPVAVALNSSAVYLGSAIGSALGGTVIAAGTAPAALPYCTAGLALLGLLLHLTAVRRATRRGTADRAADGPDER